MDMTIASTAFVCTAMSFVSSSLSGARAGALEGGAGGGSICGRCTGMLGCLRPRSGRGSEGR